MKCLLVPPINRVVTTATAAAAIEGNVHILWNGEKRYGPYEDIKDNGLNEEAINVQYKSDLI